MKLPEIVNVGINACYVIVGLPSIKDYAGPRAVEDILAFVLRDQQMTIFAHISKGALATIVCCLLHDSKFADGTVTFRWYVPFADLHEAVAGETLDPAQTAKFLQHSSWTSLPHADSTTCGTKAKTDILRICQAVGQPTVLGFARSTAEVRTEKAYEVLRTGSSSFDAMNGGLRLHGSGLLHYAYRIQTPGVAGGYTGTLVLDFVDDDGLAAVRFADILKDFDVVEKLLNDTSFPLPTTIATQPLAFIKLSPSERLFHGDLT